MRVPHDETEGTHNARVISGDMDSHVSCFELLFEGHIVVASCVFAGVVAAGVGSINKRLIRFPFTFPHQNIMCKSFSMCSRTGQLINCPFVTPFVTSAIERRFVVVHSSIGTKSMSSAQSIGSLISRSAMCL
jgi:hypothetical protein